MQTELQGSDLSFRYHAIDIRTLDGNRLLASPEFGDNVIAVLTRMQDNRDAIRRILRSIAGLRPTDREVALQALLRLAGLRRLKSVLEEEVRKMPVYIDPMDMPVIRHQYKKGIEEGKLAGKIEGKIEGELAVLRRLIEKRFGRIPAWAEKRLTRRSLAELEDLSERILDAKTLKELLS